MKAKVKIFIADDHPIFRNGLRQIIETDSRLKIVGEADNGEQAISALEDLEVDVAILDIDMPQMDGFEVVRLIKQKRLSIEVIFLTMHKDERFLNTAFDLGIKGYILKDSAVTEIVQCVKSVSEGQEFVSHQLLGFLINRARNATELARKQPQVNQLTPTERQILKLIGDYKTSKEIAEQMAIGIRTVEHHRANICEKMELKGKHALLKFAVEHKSNL
ncbi:MAG: response regulator transcription factor [Pyrinomonadaceae bacterium]|nr:response regulator transcription factor [Pyrinomonadaceae bacterium]